MVHGMRRLGSMSVRFPAQRFARVAIRKQVPVSVFTFQPRFFASNSEDPALEDRALQESFAGWRPRLHAFKKLFNNEINLDMENLMRKRIVDPMKLVSACRMFVELQNPLLTKYKFDISEFAEGVRKAYSVTTLAAAKVVEALTIRDIPIDPIQVEVSHSILKEVYCDELSRQLEIALEETKLINETFLAAEISKKLKVNIKFPTVMLSKVNVQTVTVNKVSTRIIESHVEDSSSFDEPSTTEDLRRYKVGSVIASAEVFIEAEEEWTPTSSTMKEFEVKAHTRPTTELWVFEGCISGQTPLDWIVKSMRVHKVRMFGL